jgi:hypothetical protein
VRAADRPVTFANLDHFVDSDKMVLDGLTSWLV